MKVFVILSALIAATAAQSAISCTANNYGYKYNAASPTQYWRCQWIGLPPTLMNCAPGTFFVERLQGCDANYDGAGENNGGNGGDNGTGGNGGGTGTGGTEGGNPETGEGGNNNNNGCCCGCPANPEPVDPVDPPANPEPVLPCGEYGWMCTSFGGTMYRNPGDRASYFMCPLEGMCTVLMPCAQGTIFYPERQRCDWP